MSDLRSRLSPGAYTPLVTPFADGEIDFESFGSAIGRQIDAGTHGIVVTGTTGEPSSLSHDERAGLFAHAVETARGRVPVIAATGGPDQRATLSLTAAAARCGVDAVMIVAPAFVKPSQAGLLEHFTTVARSTDLPVLLYNIPGRTGVAIDADTVKRIVAACPHVIGVKHASADLDYLTDLVLALGDDFHLFCGLESFSYPFLCLGGSGLMNAVGNLLPERVVALCDVTRRGDHGEALAIHRELFAINRAIFFDTNPGPLKAMLDHWNMGSAELRPPLVALDETTAARVVAVLDHYEARHPQSAARRRSAALTRATPH